AGRHQDRAGADGVVGAGRRGRRSRRHHGRVAARQRRSGDDAGHLLLGYRGRDARRLRQPAGRGGRGPGPRCDRKHGRGLPARHHRPGAQGIGQPADHPGRAAVPAVGAVRIATGGAGVKPLRVDQNSPAHWALRAVGVAAVAYLALSPLFRDLKPADYGEYADIAILALAALSLNLLVGFTGQISIGHSAFFGLGAYTTAILIDTHGWSAGWTFPVAAALCFVVGVLVGIPALRLTGVYLSLVTLALAQLFPALIRKFDDVTGGSIGIGGLRYDPPSWTGLDPRSRAERTEWLYVLALIMLVIGYVVVRNLVKS